MNGNETFDNVPAEMGAETNDPFGGQGGLPGGSNSFAPFTTGAPKKSISSGTIIVAVIVVAAGGLLFGMRHFGMGPVMSLTEVKIDYEPNHETEAERNKAVEVMAELGRSATPTQIPAGWIERDPFLLAALQTIVEPDSTGTVPDIDPDAIRRAELRGKVDVATESIEIQSVMGGRVPLARVNGKTLQIGDQIEEVLTLIAIEGRSAIFKGEDGRMFRAETGEALTEIQPEE